MRKDRKWHFALILVALAGCGGEVDAAHYGPANGLRGQTPRPVDADGGGAVPPVDGTDAGTGTPNAACGGKGTIDAGTCAVSWKTNLFPRTQASGHWKCSDAACHGSKNGGSPPLIDPTSSDLAYTQLLAFVASNGRHYFNPCSANTADSAFACSLQANGCTSQMPLLSASPGAALLTTQELADVTTWVQCGSPMN